MLPATWKPWRLHLAGTLPRTEHSYIGLEGRKTLPAPGLGQSTVLLVWKAARPCPYLASDRAQLYWAGRPQDLARALPRTEHSPIGLEGRKTLPAPGLGQSTVIFVWKAARPCRHLASDRAQLYWSGRPQDLAGTLPRTEHRSIGLEGLKNLPAPCLGQNTVILGWKASRPCRHLASDRGQSTVLLFSKTARACRSVANQKRADMDYMISERAYGDPPYACVYTRGLGTPTTSQHNIFDSENVSQIVLLTEFELGSQ